MGWLKRIFRLEAKEVFSQFDEFNLVASGLRYAENRLVTSFLNEAQAFAIDTRKPWHERYPPAQLPGGLAIIQSSPTSRSWLLAIIYERQRLLFKLRSPMFSWPLDARTDPRYIKLEQCDRWLSALLKCLSLQEFEWQEESLLYCVKTCLDSPYDQRADTLPSSIVLNVLKEMKERGSLTPRLKEAADALLGRLHKDMRGDADGDRTLHQLDHHFSEQKVLPFESGEVWADTARSNIQLTSPEVVTHWDKFLRHCLQATATDPSKKWLKAASELLIANEEMNVHFRSAVPQWFALVEEPRTEHHGRLGTGVGSNFITTTNKDILCGLAWTCGLMRDKGIGRALTKFALSCFKKYPGIGALAPRVGHACISALGMMGTEDALGQLALLKARVRILSAQAAIEKTLKKLAQTLEVSREDIEELSAPAYGMSEVGKLVQPIGEFTAELNIINSRSTELVWKRANGKQQKSLPAAVKQEHAEDVKELMAAKKDIERMLPAQAERLDGLYLQHKTWPFEIWRERYLDHPLIGALARRLIWNFTVGDVTTPGLWLNGQLMDRSAQALDLDPEQTTVTLWHPLDQAPDVVLGWRGFLEEWEIVQPFKQAHREVYLLTPAEEQTRVYSNRFAAHLLRQHQFNALCAARGWKNKLRLMVDAEYPPATRWLPQWNLRAEYWIEGAGTEYGTDTLDSGAYRYVTTDQVRFYQADAAQVSAHAGGGGYGAGFRHPVMHEPLPLADIPPIVFSEIMRDVDLFVGVGSVGNDPNWLDGGTNENQRGYWQSVSFGDLNASAQTRKVILERLIPKLKIAKQCSFADKFLVVQGKCHAYKIHLGSGNILISPQDKYLCIVPAQAQVDKAGEKVFLPFEGDRVLSVILSKAFLLAADDKITDATILRQLV